MEGFAVCATVNATNGFGGYTGRQPWLFLWWESDGRSGINAIPFNNRTVPTALLVHECELPVEGLPQIEYTPNL